MDLGAVEVFNMLPRCLNLRVDNMIKRMKFEETRRLTLIARVRIAAITLREPPRTRLLAWVGSYSQMVVAFSTATIFVIWPITSTFPRLTT